MITALFLILLVTVLALVIGIAGLVLGLIWRLIVWIFESIGILFRGY